MVSTSNPIIQKALAFIDGLREDEGRTSYYEIVEDDPNEHKVFPQSQYLLYIMFNQIGQRELAEKIAQEHDFAEMDTVDPHRKGRPANDSFCVLEGKIEAFRHAGEKDCENNDEKTLLAIYWLERKHRLLGWLYRKNAHALWTKLHAQYDPTKGVLEMDTADRKLQLYSVFKVALFGVLAKRMYETDVLANVRQRLAGWQCLEGRSAGGWETDRTIELKAHGYANLETTALCILALVD